MNGIKDLIWIGYDMEEQTITLILGSMSIIVASALMGVLMIESTREKSK